MATARDYFRHAERALAAVHEDSEMSHALLLEAIANGILAVGMGLGVHLPPLPTLDRYCICPLTPRGETFTHNADCPKRPMTDAEAAAFEASLTDAINKKSPTASPVRDS
jgi:hypothetical protein